MFGFVFGVIVVVVVLLFGFGGCEVVGKLFDCWFN